MIPHDSGNLCELDRLIDGACERTLTSEEWGDLSRRLVDDAQARDRYMASMNLHGMLALHTMPAGRLSVAELQRFAAAESDACDADETDPDVIASPSPCFVLSDPTVRSQGWPLSSGWAVAYLIATAVFVVGLAIGAVVHVSQPTSIVLTSPSKKAAGSEGNQHAPAFPIVARVTAMVDCECDGTGFRIQGSGDANQQSQIIDHKSVINLGDRLALKSGLLELTYDTGAKVILQGPVTYEVESPSGGYLAIGRLTAKLEQKSEVRGQRPESANQKSEIRNQKSFSVRTPTALVTDLGTEFGVEVDRQGRTHSHVFCGVVEVRGTASSDKAKAPTRLTADEAVLVQRKANGDVAIQRTQADPKRFVRSEQMQVAGKDSFAKTARRAARLWPLLDRTLVAWLSLDNLEQPGVGVVSIANMPEWDGIVFGELSPRKWMAGSHMWARSEKDQSAYSIETADRSTLLQIAAVYSGTTITLYRNGVEYAKYDTGMVQSYSSDAVVLIGKRHPRDGSSQPPTLVGSVEEVRIYNTALSPSTIAVLKPNERSPISPMGCWTFEDGTTRDAAGNFPMGELHGNASIDHGKLILDGKDSYLLVPSPGVNQKTSLNQKN